jgi:hypothetical protein
MSGRLIVLPTSSNFSPTAAASIDGARGCTGRRLLEFQQFGSIDCAAGPPFQQSWKEWPDSSNFCFVF